MLGSFELRWDDIQVPKPPTIKSQSLLAYLAIHHNQPQSRDKLASLFWGERPERRARRSLTTALWHIRRCLPEENLILGDAHSVQLDPQANLYLDITVFEALSARSDISSLQNAVLLYRGDFMENFYDDWVLNERYRLETLFSEALERLMMELEAGGEYKEALNIGLRLLQNDTLREDAHRLVMRAFCNLGQRNAALEQYRRCQQIVKLELDVEPMAETSELYQSILDESFEVGDFIEALTVEGVIEEPTLPSGQNPLDPFVSCPLVGREPEMAFLQDCFLKAQQRQGGLVLLIGEAGLGKTRLVEELTERLRWQGVRVLWGRCYEFERILPYQPVGEALQTVLSTLSPGDLTNLPPWLLKELTRLIPDLSEKIPGLQTSDKDSLDQEQIHLFEGVSRFLAYLSNESELVLILDDLHWASESTLQMVHYLTRHLSKQPILIIGALRPEVVGPGHMLHSLQQQLSQEGLVRSLNLVGLSSQAIDTLVTGMSGGSKAIAPLAHRLYQETEGNPFYLIEIVKALFETGLLELDNNAWSGDFTQISHSALPLPAGLSEAIQARILRLNQDVQQALEVASILGREFDFELLNAAWKQEEEATLEALDALLRRRFIREGSGILSRDYAFHHHKIQEVVYSGISLQRRRILHARAGKALELLNESNLMEISGELAFHFDQGRYVDKSLLVKTIYYLLLSGDQARLSYAHREAIHYYTRAIELQKLAGEFEAAGRTSMKLGLVHHSNFNYVKAREAFEEGFIEQRHAATKAPLISLPSAPHALRIRWRRPYSLDPGLCEEYVSTLVIDQMFRGLVSTDAELAVVPEVAQRWEILDGGRRYRFHLQPEARWSDGVPLTAHDFEFAWKRTLDPANDVYPNFLFIIKGAKAFHQGNHNDEDTIGVRALDNYTLDVELEKPASHFLYMLADVATYPIPRHVIATHGANWTDVDKIVSNGPFFLDAWDPNFMSLRRNPQYTGHPQGNIEQVILHFPQDQSTQDLSLPLEQYMKGELDVLTLTDASVHEGDRIRRQFASEYVSAPWLFTIYLGCVTFRPPFDDIRLRQAFAMAIDREELASVVLRGMYDPGVGGFVPPGMPGHSEQIGLAHNPSRAQQLMAEAGFPGGSGLPVLEALSVPPIDPLVTNFLQTQWEKELGIQVEWQVLDWPPFSQRLLNDPPHLFNLARFANLPDPSRILAPDTIQEYTRWTNQSYSDLIENAEKTLDQNIRLDLICHADRILMKEAAIIPLFYGRQHLLVKPWVHSFPISPLNRWFWENAIIEPH